MTQNPTLKDHPDAASAAAELLRPFLSNHSPTPISAAVKAAEVPAPFHDLLVHHEHMTLRLQAHYGEPVQLHVVRHREEGDVYRRMIHLSLQGSNETVELGVVRLDLSLIAEVARREILEGQTPLGDILVRHDVLRRIEPRGYLRFPVGCGVAQAYGVPQTEHFYGRVGVIHCDHQPTIELLEIVTGAARSGKEPKHG